MCVYVCAASTNSPSRLPPTTHHRSKYRCHSRKLAYLHIKASEPREMHQPTAMSSPDTRRSQTILDDFGRAVKEGEMSCAARSLNTSCVLLCSVAHRGPLAQRYSNRWKPTMRPRASLNTCPVYFVSRLLLRTRSLPEAAGAPRRGRERLARGATVRLVRLHSRKGSESTARQWLARQQERKAIAHSAVFASSGALPPSRLSLPRSPRVRQASSSAWPRSRVAPPASVESQHPLARVLSRRRRPMRCTS